MKPLVSFEFDAKVIYWRGPAPYLFAPIPDHHAGDIKFAARMTSYGWGVVPVEAKIGTTDFTTSLFPRDDTYWLPIKVAVQRAAGIGLGDTIRATVRVFTAAASRPPRR
jgi:hypothetical protein